MNYALDNIINQNMFLVTVFVGMITFSIPFLWHAYQRLLDQKKYTIGEKIENILVKEFYHKSVKSFERLVQYPVGIFIFLGLFVIPTIFSFELAVVSLTLIFIYFLFLPQIFHFIENKSSTDLKDFLKYKEIKSNDVLQVFKELWQKKDDEIEKEFSIKPARVFEYFYQRINELIGNKEWRLVKEYFNDFTTFINNRSIHFLLSWSNDVFQKILEWHFKIWKKEHECLIAKGKSDEWRSYNEISRILGYSLKQIEKRAFQDQISPPLFFDVLEKYAEKYKEQFIKDKDGKDIYYVGFLFKAFYEVFFEVIENPSGRHSIWRHFPQEWKITASNLSKEESVSWVSWRNFFNWAQGRIWYPKEDSDQNLSEVINELFPEVDPVLWARVLIFVFSPYGENRVQSVIEKPWNFGTRRSIVHFGYSENELKKMCKIAFLKNKTEINNAFELADLLFKDQFSEENLKKYIDDLEKLKYDKEKESKEENKRLQLLTLFEKMLKYKSSV